MATWCACSFDIWAGLLAPALCLRCLRNTLAVCDGINCFCVQKMAWICARGSYWWRWGVVLKQLLPFFVLPASVLPMWDLVSSLIDQLITQFIHSANQDFWSFLYLKHIVTDWSVVCRVSVKPWASHLFSLSLSYLFCEMGMIILISQDGYEDKWGA